MSANVTVSHVALHQIHKNSANKTILARILFLFCDRTLLIHFIKRIFGIQPTAPLDPQDGSLT